MRKLAKDGQAGDRRERALQPCVLANAGRSDLDDAIATIDRFAYTSSFLMNGGDENGAFLDGAITRAQPTLFPRTACPWPARGDRGQRP